MVKARAMALVAVLGMAGAARGQTPSFQGLGALPGGVDSLGQPVFYSIAQAVSGDGSTIVGQSWGANGKEPFIWTKTGGMVGLGGLSQGGEGGAQGVSFDGSVVVGESDFGGAAHPFQWTKHGGLVDLGLPAGVTFGYASAVSQGGLVAVGVGGDGMNFYPVKWTQGQGPVKLEDRPGGTINAQANSVSADGSIAVGQEVTDKQLQAMK